jgi:hypothetical protein
MEISLFFILMMELFKDNWLFIHVLFGMCDDFLFIHQKFPLSYSGLVWLSSEIILSWAYQLPGDGRSTVRNELFIVHIQSGYFMHQ